MARKNKNANVITTLQKNKLPQNIVLIGEIAHENKSIYINQKTYKKIHDFTFNKKINESGGLLVGDIIEEFGKINIVINVFLEAKFVEATPTTLKFTHETWNNWHEQINKNHKDKKIVGWIHTHPDYGIFLSEYDKFIHNNFFKEKNQVAYVIDPIRKEEGFYFWINNNIELSTGFYVFDKTGVKINIDKNKESSNIAKDKTLFNFTNVMFLILSSLSIFQMLYILNLDQKIKLQERAIENFKKSVIFVDPSNIKFLPKDAKTQENDNKNNTQENLLDSGNKTQINEDHNKITNSPVD